MGQKTRRSTLREASLSPSKATRLMVDLGEHGASLPRLAKSLASLAVVQAHLGGDPVRLRKAEGMLNTLLEALASSRPAKSSRSA